MSDEKATLYLEDIDKSSFQAAQKKAASLAAQASQSSVTTEKKTRKIETFFSSQPSQKKLRAESGAGVPASSSNASLTTLPKLNSIPFSLTNFQKSLSDEEKGLLQLECETLGLSWMKLLQSEIRKPYFLKLKKFLWDNGLKSAQNTPQTVNIYPPAKDIYNWSKTPLGKVKVVIIGQGSQNSSFGLVIYRTYLLKPRGMVHQRRLNAQHLPDVKASEAGSHSRKGWEQFTEKVVEVVDQYGGANLPAGASGSESTGVGRGIVFLAWGAWASERVSKLSKSKHLVLTSAHPSPRSADKGFFGNGHFQKANEWLEEKYGPDGKVDWCCIGAQTTQG
ncbi:hypothetical protein EST38_g1550 [Candolleomyces aberdarensis]|uniref:Uracil-DNA glycosylase n=1 Tax=Candolleomyces aberdarensis TaxID=2316362 RepID=A0A4V1Q542_9AGAR|nr:hypothetical protein EST38_g1550 [Candolleomyces aberdarensis]